MRNVPALDGVRALAAALVLLTHVAFQSGVSGQSVGGALCARGDIGVAIFFVLSGLLLTRGWLDPGAGDLRRYLTLRGARILPAYWVALGAVLLSGLSDPSTRAVMSNVLLVQVYTQDFLDGFTQTWSLSTEVAFYVALPLLVIPARSRWAPQWIGSLVLTGLACTGIAALVRSSVLALGLAGHLAWFATGMGLALLHRSVTEGGPGPRTTSVVSAFGREPGTALAIAASLFLLVATPVGGPWDLTHPTVLQSVLKEGLYTVIALLVVAAALFARRDSPTARLLGSPVGHWGGRISYGVFLWHLLVLELIGRALGLHLFGGQFWFRLTATALISAGIAWVSLVVLEDPVLRRVRQRTADQGQRRDARELAAR